MSTFIGRKNELMMLNHLRKKTTASLVCVLGRRRIGKSSLIEEFAKCKKIIDKSVINEVAKKLKAIKLPTRSIGKPVLVYEGEISPPHLEEIENYFYKIVHFQELLT